MNRFLLFLTLVILTDRATAQITIDDTDFANANETVVYSQASTLTTVDLTLTGPAYYWDFSQLTSTGQTADTFVTVSSFGNIYSLFFINSSFNPNQSNLAVRGSFPTAPGVTITDVYNFYYKSVTGYNQTGIGATINGTQAPVAYSDQDAVYSFPLNFLDMDTSISNFGISIPGLGSYYGHQTRIVNVDGYGTVVTPFGSFNCLREVAMLTGHDSVHVDSLNFGIGFDRTLTREYKWLAKGEDGPVLQITTQELIPGTEVITAIIYRDSVITSSVYAEKNADKMEVYPNPSSDHVNIRVPTSFNGGTVALFTPQGQSIWSNRLSFLPGRNQFSIATGDFPSGLYYIHISDGKTVRNEKIIISH
jgi:hypothetical protein